MAFSLPLLCVVLFGFVLVLSVCLFVGVFQYFGLAFIIKLLIIPPSRMLMFEVCFLNLAFLSVSLKKKCFQDK